MQLIRRFHSLFYLAGSHKKKLVMAAILSICAALVGLLPFFIVADLGQRLYADTLTQESLWDYAIIICGLLLLKYVLLGSGKALFHLVAYLTMYDLQIQLSEKIGRMPLGDINDQGSARLKKTILQDTDITHTIIGHYIEDFLTGIVVPFATLAAFFYIDWHMGLVATALFPALFWAYKASFKNFDQEAENYFQADEHMQSSFNEYVSGIAAIKTFNHDLSNKLIQATQDHVRHIVNWTKKTIFSWTAFTTVAESSLLIILPAGLVMVMYEVITPAAFFFFLLLGINLLQPFIRLAIQIGFLNYASKSIERIEALLKANTLPDPAEPGTPQDCTIDLEQVDFYYGEHRAIKNVDLSIKEGQICAFVGPSGAGKTTLAQLIGRFWDVHSGTIKIGGVDIRQMSEAQLYGQVAFVFQDVFLFNDTILENLRLANPQASREAVISACKAARAHEFIMQLSEGYDSRVGEKGVLLSSGQKQRLSIARAMLRNAPILILDEATSYADPINEADIQKALSHLMKGRTVIIIAHRLHTIKNVDQIIVLDNGQVVDYGSHQKLLKECNVYKSMWDDYQQEGRERYNWEREVA